MTEDQTTVKEPTRLHPLPHDNGNGPPPPDTSDDDGDGEFCVCPDHTLNAVLDIAWQKVIDADDIDPDDAIDAAIKEVSCDEHLPSMVDDIGRRAMARLLNVRFSIER